MALELISNDYLKLKWYKDEITELIQLRNILADVKQNKFSFLTLDTETSGLHIRLDNPFCVTFATIDQKNKIGYSYALDLRDKPDIFLTYLQEIINNTKLLILWNAKFDIHMLANIGIDLFKARVLTDGMIFARLATDALTPAKGGPVLGLKAFAKRFVDPNADYWEKEISKLKKDVLIKRNTELKKLGVKIGDLNDYLKDLINDINDLPIEVQKILKDPKYNPNDYRNLPWMELKEYAIYDVIYTAECYLYCLPIVKERQQLEIAKEETEIIPILWNMERSGLKLNKFYLIETKERVRQYIKEQRNRLNAYVGQPMKIGQHELIKRIFEEKFNITLVKSDEEALQKIGKTTDNETAKIVTKLIIELRTLEKWYSTYICKWLEYADRTDRIYTEFNQVGAVSGRFSSDFQQFPKDPILKEDGTELFVPRRIVKVSNESGYKKLCFIDFSAEELRIQAAYTILVGHPDVNLCRAFMPFECDPNKWEPTDLHSLTTLKAFPELSKDDPNFKHYRYMGKRANFCINYGGGVSALMDSLNIDFDTASKLYNAYKQAYPGVQEYRDYVARVLYKQDYITNLFGRRYYNASAFNCCNYLVQGSGADLLKTKLIELEKFLRPYKTRMIFMVHDEIVYEIYEGEEFIIPQLKQIMESFPELPIPLKSEVEITSTTWDAKQPCEY